MAESKSKPRTTTARRTRHWRVFPTSPLFSTPLQPLFLESGSEPGVALVSLVCWRKCLFPNHHHGPVPFRCACFMHRHTGKGLLPESSGLQHSCTNSAIMFTRVAKGPRDRYWRDMEAPRMHLNELMWRGIEPSVRSPSTSITPSGISNLTTEALVGGVGAFNALL